MAPFNTLTVEALEGGTICRITLNRPEKMNALSQELLFELNEALHDAAGEDTVAAGARQAVPRRGAARSSA